MKRTNAIKKYLAVDNSYEGETLEQKIERLIQNKEPLEGSAPLTYTEKKDGVQPQYNIRTDRFEIAAEAMDKVNKARIAKSADSPEMWGEGKTESKPAEGTQNNVGEA